MSHRFVISNPRTVKVQVEVEITYDTDQYGEPHWAVADLLDGIERSANDQQNEYLHVESVHCINEEGKLT